MKPASECQRIWDTISAGEPGAPQSALVKAHIAICPDCAQDLRLLRCLDQTLANAERPEPPIHLRNRILAATVDRPSALYRAMNWLFPLQAPAKVAFGAAACAALLVSVSLLSRQNEFAVSPEVAPPPQAVAQLQVQKFRANGSEVAGITAMDLQVFAASVAKKVSDSARQPGMESSNSHSVRTIQPRAESIPAPAQSSDINPIAPESPRIETPETEKAAPISTDSTPEPKLERDRVEPAASITVEPARIARAEERPQPIPETKSMYAGSAPGQASYTMEARTTIDPGAAATLADLRRTIHKESESDQPGAAFRMDDRREVRVSVHTSRF